MPKLTQNVEQIDARKQSREVLHARRKQVIDLYQSDMPVMQIVKCTGLSWSAVNSAIKRFKIGGVQSLEPEARGRKQGTGRSLTEKQENEIRNLIRKRVPWFYGLHDYLWTRDAVIALVKQKCQINLSDRSAGDYLTRWGLSLKNAKKRPVERCANVIQRWLDVHYKEIDRQAKELDAEIYWLNKPVPIDSKLWDQKPAPNVPQSGNEPSGGTPRKLSMASAVTNQGKMLWSICNGTFGPDRQIKFTKALLKDTRRKIVFLIRCDQVSYCSNQYMHWIRENKLVIKVFPDSKDITQESTEC